MDKATLLVVGIRASPAVCNIDLEKMIWSSRLQPHPRLRHGRGSGTVSFVVLLTLAAAQLPAQEVPERPGTFREEARVERVVVDAYVTDRRGDPIPGLDASEFLVKVDGKPVLLESVEWVPADVPEAVALPTRDQPVLAHPPGRLIVLFYQTDHEPLRITGFFRMANQVDRLLETLLPTDRVAVLSYDSHLKLRQDFTNDVGKIRGAIEASLRTGAPPPPQLASFPSLARYLDFRAARRASTPERAIGLTARALAPIPGAKSMLYFGWGLGSIGGAMGPNLTEQRDYLNALRALSRARVNIFTLDVTDADYHTLETSLMAVSDMTGGTYQKTHLFPRLALDRVTRAISGRYVLVFVKPRGPRGIHTIDVKLARRKGEVSARAYYED